MGWGEVTRPRLTVESVARALHVAEPTGHRWFITNALRCDECMRRAATVVSLVNCDA